MDCNGVVWEHFGWVWHVGFIESNYFPCQMGYLYMLGYELSIYEIMSFDVFNFPKKGNDENNEKNKERKKIKAKKQKNKEKSKKKKIPNKRLVQLISFSCGKCFVVKR